MVKPISRLVPNRTPSRLEAWISEWLCLIDATLAIVTYGYLRSSLVLDFYVFIGVYRIELVKIATPSEDGD